MPAKHSHGSRDKYRHNLPSLISTTTVCISIPPKIIEIIISSTNSSNQKHINKKKNLRPDILTMSEAQQTSLPLRTNQGTQTPLYTSIKHLRSKNTAHRFHVQIPPNPTHMTRNTPPPLESRRRQQRPGPQTSSAGRAGARRTVSTSYRWRPSTTSALVLATPSGLARGRKEPPNPSS